MSWKKRLKKKHQILILTKYSKITDMEQLPLLSENEMEVYQKYFAPAQTIVEFGSGGSTLHALINNKKVYSVENNPVFYKVMLSTGLVQENFGKNLHYHFVDMGATSEWGEPLDETPHPRWWMYYESIWAKVKEEVDFIYIDGRFRVMCALHALKHMEVNKWNAVLCIHDFTIREQYHVLLDFFEVVDRAGTLVVLKPKEYEEVKFGEAMWNYHNDFR